MLNAENIYKDYYFGETIVHALKTNSFQFQEGKFYAIKGRSGSGKSTLLRILGTLETPSGGEIIFRGRSIQDASEQEKATMRQREIGMVFQEYCLMQELSVYENIRLPMRLDRRKEDKEYLDFLLKELGLAERKNFYPKQLSGGEIQRTAIARALANKPALLLADEPTGQLDEATAFSVVELLRKFSHDYRQTILMVTHDKQMAQYADEIWKITDGNIQGQRGGGIK